MERGIQTDLMVVSVQLLIFAKHLYDKVHRGELPRLCMC